MASIPARKLPGLAQAPRCVAKTHWNFCSLTTTTGQGKGTASPPAAKPFPLPYADNFDTTPLGHTAKYLSDQDGAFEVRDCYGRAGRCLEQVISDKPIPWNPLPDPFTMAGDESWTDYRVLFDVRFLSKAPAVVMGRIDSSDVFKDDKLRLPSGYGLRVKPDGAWELFSSEYKKTTVTIAFGSTTIERNQWHRLELSFHGRRIGASLDGKSLVTVENSAHSHGMFALATEWDYIQFDNTCMSNLRNRSRIDRPIVVVPVGEPAESDSPVTHTNLVC